MRGRGKQCGGHDDPPTLVHDDLPPKSFVFRSLCLRAANSRRIDASPRCDGRSVMSRFSAVSDRRCKGAVQNRGCFGGREMG
ncbi:hypothetical protein MYA_1127 [Burkholderia sp. KJ006]|nr:hypothetical protein MYA_1127 [Burkholderia sp. KJ006]